MNIKSQTMWMIHGCHGFYVDAKLTRKEMIAHHCFHLDRTWRSCRSKGDRAIKVKITPIK